MLFCWLKFVELVTAGLAVLTLSAIRDNMIIHVSYTETRRASVQGRESDDGVLKFKCEYGGRYERIDFNGKSQTAGQHS